VVVTASAAVAIAVPSRVSVLVPAPVAISISSAIVTTIRVPPISVPAVSAISSTISIPSTVLSIPLAVAAAVISTSVRSAGFITRTLRIRTVSFVRGRFLLHRRFLGLAARDKRCGLLFEHV
jgi:hypothetical protein